MARDLPEEIASSTLAPINRVAKKVTQRGTHWEPKIPPTEVFSVLPLPTRRVTGNGIDLTGMSFGRLTVVGLAALASKGPARWVVRCACGSYSHRKAKVLQSPEAHRTAKMCKRCDLVEKLRRDSGNWPDRSKEER